MADQQQQQGQQKPGVPDMPQARSTIVDDDYAYEIKPLPKKGPDQGQAAQSGGMASQFDAVTSGIDNAV
jgi:hypothetical protein